MLNIGQTLQNRYAIQAVLGQGGMGAVYVAADGRTRIQCVVKQMQVQGLTQQDIAEAQAQFQQEAITLAGLHHPNLPRVTDYFSEQGSYFLVMDYVAGHNLASLIGNTGLPEAQAMSYTTQLLDALSYCHSRGVLHRDIKPQNIVVRPDGTAVLVDFGLVKVVNSAARATTKTFLRGMGTPNYAPPEQYGGGTDARSDVYSLGATLYHALTGQLPASATDRSAGVTLSAPRTFNRTVSPTTEQAVLQAMTLDRNQRFQSAAAFKQALTQAAPFASPTPTLLAPPPPPPVAAPAQNLRWEWLGLGLLLLGVAVGAWVLWGNGLSPSPDATTLAINTPSAQPPPTATALAIAPAASHTPASVPAPTPTLMSAPSPTPAPSAPNADTAPERVRFASGATVATLQTNLLAGQPKRYVLRVSDGQRIQASFSRAVSAEMRDPSNGLMSPLVKSDRYLEVIASGTGDYTLSVVGKGVLEVTITIPPAASASASQAGAASTCADTSPFRLSASQMQRLDCASQGFVRGRIIVSQQFERGFMLIFDDASNSDFQKPNQERKFFAIANDGRAWRVFFANEQVPQTTSANPNDWYTCEKRPGQRPEQSGVPWRGFGLVWCNHPEIRAALGHVRPGNAEVKGRADFQSFWRGRAFTYNGRTYVVYLNTVRGEEAFISGAWE